MQRKFKRVRIGKTHLFKKTFFKIKLIIHNVTKIFRQTLKLMLQDF